MRYSEVFTRRGNDAYDKAWATAIWSVSEDLCGVGMNIDSWALMAVRLGAFVYLAVHYPLS